MFFIDVASRPPHSPGFPPTLRRFLRQSAWMGPNFIPDLFLLDAQVALLKSSLILLIVYLTLPLKCLRENSNLPQPCITYNVPLLSQWQPYYSSCSDKKSWGPESLLVHDLVSCPTGKKHRPDFLPLGFTALAPFLLQNVHSAIAPKQFTVCKIVLKSRMLGNLGVKLYTAYS